MSEWLERKALDMPPGPVVEPAEVPGMEPQKSLDEIKETREPVLPNPTGNPEPVEPLSLKELAGLLEEAAKSLLGSVVGIEKAHVALSKVGAMSSQTDKDREIASKTKGYAAESEKLLNSIKTLAKDIEVYRESISAPVSPWLE